MAWGTAIVPKLLNELSGLTVVESESSLPNNSNITPTSSYSVQLPNHFPLFWYKWILINCDPNVILPSSKRVNLRSSPILYIPMLTPTNPASTSASKWWHRQMDTFGMLDVLSSHESIHSIPYYMYGANFGEKPAKLFSTCCLQVSGVKLPSAQWAGSCREWGGLCSPILKQCSHLERGH